MIMVLAVPVLTSCSVPTGGVAGVTVDATGAVIAVISTCTHPVDGATLYDSSESGDQEILTRWQSMEDTNRSVVSLPITGGAGTGIAPVSTYRDLPTTELSVYGWTRDNSTSAEHVTFVPGDLAGLGPGQVLTGPWYDDDGVARHRIVPIGDLHDVACEFTGP